MRRWKCPTLKSWETLQGLIRRWATLPIANWFLSGTSTSFTFDNTQFLHIFMEVNFVSDALTRLSDSLCNCHIYETLHASVVLLCNFDRRILGVPRFHVVSFSFSVWLAASYTSNWYSSSRSGMYIHNESSNHVWLELCKTEKMPNQVKKAKKLQTIVATVFTRCHLQ